MSDAATTIDVTTVDLRFEPRPWPFAIERAEAIQAHWRGLVADKPKLFDGRVLLQHRGAVETDAGGRAVFRGAYLDTDFAAFLAWRDWGFPAAGVRNGFGMAALSSADGAFVLGEMAGHTSNAGKIYFASGTPDPHDIRDGAVDIAGSVRRELAEETGLDPDTCAFDEGFTLIIDPVRVAFMKRVRAPEPADALVERIHAFLAREASPELARMHVVRRAADIPQAVLPFVADYLRANLAG